MFKRWYCLITLLFLPILGFAENNCVSNDQAHVTLNSNNSIKVMTANIAHGRASNFSQITTTTNEIKHNLTALSSHFSRFNPDILALQELDSASWWSGNFDHANYLIARTSFNSYMVSNHVDAWWGTYGTGIFSNYTLVDCKGFTFEPSFPTTNKGYSYAEIELNNGNRIAVVSLHLDFSRASIRTKQIAELQNRLNVIDKPLIIMGDFNTDWRWNSSIIKTLSQTYGLKVYKPDSEHLNTFGKNRIDWIIVSKHFKFKRYENIGAGLSDHLFVIAELVYEAI